MSDFPPSDGAKFMAWVNAQETPSVVTKVKQAQNHIETKGVTSFGVVGFCWGSGASLYMARTDICLVLCLHSPVVQNGSSWTRFWCGAHIDCCTPAMSYCIVAVPFCAEATSETYPAESIIVDESSQ